jgi:tRNA uridine 5-carboxymethylaminomethyl modification enzyme
MYVQGMSTSMPEDVQISFMQSIPGLENVEIMRPAYAIEYDCIDPTQLKLSLEFKHIDGLFSAGQFNGSSGYEEAAAQGLIAGINAVLKIDEKAPFILDRSEAYIAVLIDDLVTKGTEEPYRMMTSRAEYRLILRQDNADLRLTEKSYDVGLASQERYDRVARKIVLMEKELDRMQSTLIKARDINSYLESIGSSPLRDSITIANILKRPEIFYDQLAEFDINRPSLREDIWKQCEISIKYEGYISKQLKQVDKFKSLENKKIRDIDFNDVEGLRLEARQKLNDIKPTSIGQASRISGVSPADISVLLVYLDYKRRSKNES